MQGLRWPWPTALPCCFYRSARRGSPSRPATSPPTTGTSSAGPSPPRSARSSIRSCCWATARPIPRLDLYAEEEIKEWAEGEEMETLSPIDVPLNSALLLTRPVIARDACPELVDEPRTRGCTLPEPATEGWEAGQVELGVHLVAAATLRATLTYGARPRWPRSPLAVPVGLSKGKSFPRSRLLLACAGKRSATLGGTSGWYARLPLALREFPFMILMVPLTGRIGPSPLKWQQ